jgi:steroid 5-alpha reductase family enzyme
MFGHASHGLFVSHSFFTAFLFLQQHTKLPPLTIWHSIVTILWGLRLFTFLTYREYVSWPALHQKVVEVQGKMNIPYASKVLCWLVYSFFYLALMASCWSRHQQGAALVAIAVAATTTAPETLSSSVTAAAVPTHCWGVLGYVGLLMQSTGLVLESVADLQKTKFKSRNHFTWCNIGLWRISTHPNYFGEGLFWLGTYLSHGFYSIFHSLLATVGLAFIMVVLKGSARSLASKQKEKYGQDPDFCDFQRSHNVFGPKHWWVTTPGSNINNSNRVDVTNNEELHRPFGNDEEPSVL